MLHAVECGRYYAVLGPGIGSALPRCCDATRVLTEAGRCQALVEEEAKIEHQRNLAITVERDR